MSHSDEEESPAADPYAAGWAAINRLLRTDGSWSGREANVAYLNRTGADGAPRFTEVAHALGLDHPDDGRAAATLDLDYDGDEDIVVTARTEPRVRLLVNRSADGARHVAFRVVGRTSNRDAIGAVVRATPVDVDGTAVGPTQRRTRRAGHGFLAQSSAWLRFALGRDDPPDHVRVTVRWPGASQVEDFGVARTGTRHVLVEGTGRARTVDPPSAVQLAEAPLAADEPPSEVARIVLAAPLPVPSLAAVSASGRSGSIFGVTPGGAKGTGRPFLLVPFASWCAACDAELERLAGAADQLEEAGLDVLALSLDAPEDRDAATAKLEAVDWPFPYLFAEPEAGRVLDALVAHVRDRPLGMPLPTSFLIGPEGRVAVVYVGGTDAGTVRRDALFARAPAERRARLAAPAGGRWRVVPREPDVVGLVRRLERRDCPRAVRELSLAKVEARAVDAAELQCRFGQARAQQGDFETALQHFDAALEADPASAEAMRGRAFCLHRLQRYGEAADAWGTAVELDPTRVDAVFNRGLALAEAGRLDEARAVLARLGERSEPAAAPLVEALREAIEVAERKGPPSDPEEEDGDANGG